MAMHSQVRGVGDKGGIFWAGRPTTMLVLDDAFVQFEGQKRSRVISYGDVESARLEGAKRMRKLTIETSAGAAHMKYAGKVWADDDAVAFLSSHLGDRFTRAAG